MQDNNYAYKAGDSFPREGLEVSEERLVELSTDKNRRGYPLIELVKEDSKESGEEATPPTPEPETEKPKSKGRKGKTKNAE